MSRPRPSRASGGPSPSALPISAPFPTRRAGGFLRHAAVAALAGAIPWLTAALLVAAPAVAQQEDEDEGRPTIEAKTEGMEKLESADASAVTDDEAQPEEGDAVGERVGAAQPIVERNASTTVRTASRLSWG